MPYRVAPHVPLVMAKDRSGKILYHWGERSGCAVFDGSNVGPDIAWLNDEQRESFLRNGLVIELDEPQPDDQVDVVKKLLAARDDSDEVRAVISQLDRLGIPAGCGAPAARKALRQADIPCSNDTIAAAIRLRKNHRP